MESEPGKINVKWTQKGWYECNEFNLGQRQAITIILTIVNKKIIALKK